MINFLLKYLFISKDNEENGFVIPLILGIGLLMFLTGITMIQRGSNSETNSKLQEKSSQALAAAETGLSRLQFAINDNRTLAVYNDCVTGRETDEDSADFRKCADGESGDDSPSWANLEAIEDLTVSNGCITANVSTLSQVQEAAKTANWIAIDPNDPSKGEYRLLSYTYQALGSNPFEGPGVGILTVEGRTEQGTGSSQTENSFNTGIVRLSTQIPVEQDDRTIDVQVPGLWIAASNYMDPKGNKIRGDILIEDLNCDLNGEIPSEFTRTVNPDGSIDWANIEGDYEVKTSQIPMPDTPNLPPDDQLNILIHTNSLDQVGGTFPRGTTDPVTNIFTPTDVHIAGDNKEFHYLVPYIDKQTADINVREGYTVIFYLQGNFEIAGNTNSDETNGVGNFQIYGNTTVGSDSNGDPLGYGGTEYKYGCYPGGNPANGDCPTLEMIINGTANVRAFVHIPEGAACVNGGGSPNSPAPFEGIIWSEHWGNSELAGGTTGVACSANSKILVDAEGANGENGYKNDLLSFASLTVPDEPVISAFTQWERQEVTGE